MDLDKEKIRGNDANFILNHDIFREAWKSAEDGLAKARVKVALKDTEMHTRLIMAEQVLDIVRKYIEGVVQTGQMADMQLKAKPRFNVFR
ncbi:MAG: hypothetical protein KGH65_03805 [Candidatus Micrarchaeota archaeon]|nr:hypothetical protein [Candidatus Micrarchaeota archaeon]